MLSIKKDSVLKDYFLVKDRVADLWNAAFYNGRHVISSSSLLEANSESSTLFDMTFEEVISINRARDTLFNAVFIIIGIENQSSIDYHMPLKNFVYDAVSYNKQYRTYQMEKKENKKAKLHLLPVITLTFYYGEKRWTGPHSLLDMMNIPEQYRHAGINNWNLVEGVQGLYKWNED